MNGQSRAKAVDYSSINPLKSIQVLENYRGYNRILFLRPFMNVYIGYLDNDFMGFTVPDQLNEKDKQDDNKVLKHRKKLLMNVKEAVDYYIDNVPFKLPELEYNTFISNKIYSGYVVALKYKKEKGGI